MSAVESYIKIHSKSKSTSFILTLFFGPLGLLYSSWVGAILLMVLAFTGMSTVIVPILCWIASMLIGVSAVGSYNDKIKATAKLMWQNAA